ncbi:MAG: deoxyribodipyrimidine photo-lyase [Pseudomonadota bacterium]
MSNSPAIVWLRNDLRLTDNPALAAAVATGMPLLIVYILEEEGPYARGSAARWWLDESLRSLSSNIEKRGGRLTLRRGPATRELLSLVDETKSAHVFWNRRYDPVGIKIDTDLKSKLSEQSVDVSSFNGSVLREPWELKTGSGNFYKVYTPFWKSLQSVGPGRPQPEKAPKKLLAPKTAPASDSLDAWALKPTGPNWASRIPDIWQPGEKGAQKRLDGFLEAAASRYDEDRNAPGIEGTSRLSPHLSFGELSPNQVWQATQTLLSSGSIRQDGAMTFLSEIAWRDFAYNLLYHYPSIVDAPIKAEFSKFPWRDDDEAFERWTSGQTGVPIVDAGMRQLWQTGWMHNRVRMIVASYLTKNLMIDWRRGERWFWDCLVDADPASNTASWQWVAGSGADAAPYFRIFNPVTQSEKFDASGDYIREYVPELVGFEGKAIHNPAGAKPAAIELAGISLGTDYPEPLVDLSASRKRALAAYDHIRAA